MYYIMKNTLLPGATADGTIWIPHTFYKLESNERLTWPVPPVRPATAKT